MDNSKPPLPPKKVAAAAAVAAAKAATSASRGNHSHSKKRKHPWRQGPDHRPGLDHRPGPSMGLGPSTGLRTAKRRRTGKIILLVEASEEAREEARLTKSLKLHNELLKHALSCRNPICSANCTKMKALLHHGATCKKHARGDCSTCLSIWALLQIHAGQCRVPSHKKCPVPRCADLRNHFRQIAARRAKEKLLQNIAYACKQYVADVAKGAGISESDLWKAINKI